MRRMLLHEFFTDKKRAAQNGGELFDSIGCGGTQTTRITDCADRPVGSNRGHAATFTEHASLLEEWQGANALLSSSDVNFLRNIQGIIHLNAQVPDRAFNLRMP